MHRRAVLTAVATLTAAAGCGSGADDPIPARSAPVPPRPKPAAPAAPSGPASSALLAAEVNHGPRDVPAVALTFHGQGDPAVVQRLLDALAEGRARVTVLAVGTWLQQQPELAQRILDAGHELGNHTQHHADIAAMSDAQAFAEIDECAATLRRLTGSIGRWFRPSQTVHSTAAIRAQATRVGYRTCLSYDVDSLDYRDPGASAIVRATLQGVQNGSIVSLHFGHPGTVAAMPELLAGLHSRGLRPVTMSELVG